MRAVGIDGCPGGWICVWIDSNGDRGWQIIENIELISKLNPTVALIDIPIGLPDSEARECDLLAKKLLGPAHSRVFLYTRRGLLQFNSHEEANTWGKTHSGKGVTRQLFNILPKIREVDAFVLKHGQGVLKETHPELIFLRLNEGHQLVRKKKSAGKVIRREILSRNGFFGIDEWIEQVPRKYAKVDDLLDACACAIAARDFLANAAKRVPNGFPKCSRGLVMEMWY